eukprot:947938-Prorocentrum_minimum.AAC.1
MKRPVSDRLVDFDRLANVANGGTEGAEGAGRASFRPKPSQVAVPGDPAVPEVSPSLPLPRGGGAGAGGGRVLGGRRNSVDGAPGVWRTPQAPTLSVQKLGANLISKPPRHSR